MTREEKLGTMRSRDLVEYALRLGVKVSQSRGMLKEARAGVIKRILAAEGENVFTVEDLIQEFESAPESVNSEEFAEKLWTLTEQEQEQFFTHIQETIKNLKAE